MIGYDDIIKARQVIKNLVHKTSLIHSETFSQISGNEVFLKTENFQKTGSFKLRGASNKIANISEKERAKGVVTASAGNHAQGVAYAASRHGIKSVVVMPENTPIAKITATKGYGAQVILYGAGYDDAYNKACELQQSSGMTFIHAFNDPFVIAGQGTIGIEMLEEMNDLDIIVVPIGGGGLISGVAIAAKAMKPDIKIVGVEAEGFDSMKKSLAEGQPTTINMSNTIADGIAIKRPGDITFSLIQKYIDHVITVTEEEIAATLIMLIERAKLIVEGAGAVALAAVMDKKLKTSGKKVGVVISGGNIDINLISMVIYKGLIKSGRRVEIKTILRDKPGQLRDLLDLLAEAKVNIITVNHNREREGIDLGFAEVDMVLETRDREHVKMLCEMLHSRGYEVQI